MANTRALSFIEDSSHPWESFNTILGDHTSVMDDLFNRGVRTDLKTYVGHKDGFEYQFCKTQLKPIRKSKLHRIHLLKGKIGRGKSTFIDYCRKIVLPELYGESLMQIFVNAHSFEVNKTKRALKGKVLEGLEDFLRETIFHKSELELNKKFVDFLGGDISNQIEVIQFYETKISIKWMFWFINKLVDEGLLNIKGILITIDNIDENPKCVIKKADVFVKDLVKKANTYLKSIPLTILVPVRNYNAEAHFFTYKENNTDLRNTEEYKVVYAKIKELKKRIRVNAQFPDIAEVYNYIVRVDGILSSKQGVIVVRSENITDFLESFAELLFNSSDGKTLRLLSELSAGNLKILVGNVFNLLHSNKLPLSLLFQKHFLPDEAKQYTPIEPFTEDTVIECLLSIHFPYYTWNESHIMNLCNCNNSNKPNDFHDHLVLFRVVLAAKSLGSYTVNYICKLLKKYGYHEKLVIIALRKCFNYGIFDTDYGVKLSHLDFSKTKISLSSIGELYVGNFMKNITYYQYVCEDTYLPEKHLVPIFNKYPHETYHGSREERIMSGIKLCEYLIELLNLEKKSIENKNQVYDSFTETFGYPTITKNVPLQDIIESVKYGNQQRLKRQ